VVPTVDQHTKRFIRMPISIIKYLCAMLIACIPTFVQAQVSFDPPGAENSKLLRNVFNKKWSYGASPCDRNGGFYREFSTDSLTGEFSTVNGNRLTRTTTNIITQFKLLNDRSFSHTVTMYREGPDRSGNIIRATVLYQTHTYTLVSPSRMDYSGTHTRIDQGETHKQGKPVFKTDQENGYRLLCP